MATLIWKGDEVLAKVKGAAKLGIDETMAACVEHAKDNHPGYPPASEPYTRFANRTAHLVSSLQIIEDAQVDDDTIRGTWGSDAEEALYLEIGTSVEGPTAPDRAALGDLLEGTIPPPEGPLMAPRPYLRPAADDPSGYPSLARRIAEAFRAS